MHHNTMTAFNIVFTFYLVFVVMMVHAAQLPGGAATTKKNVLMIVVDDLRPEIGAFYDTRRRTTSYWMNALMHTPSLDALAAHSLVLRRAYVQQAICAPSRLSLLTSRRPDTTRVYTLRGNYWRSTAGDLVTLPQFFKLNGYLSVGIGKVFHHGRSSNKNDPPSWTEYHPIAKSSKDHWNNRSRSWVAVEPADRQHVPLPDDLVASKAIEILRHFADGRSRTRRPLFLAVGFYKPHLPFVFPKQYFDLYPDVHLPQLTRSSSGNGSDVGAVDELARSRWEVMKYSDIAALNVSADSWLNTDIRLPDGVVRALRRAYYSTVSYIDDMVGSILRELDQLGLANNTVVAFLGDHGCHLGENNLWGKHTNFELSTRTPMMIRVPGATDGGVVFDAPVELVDLFPTLVQAAGFDPLPVCPVPVSTEQSPPLRLCTEGASLISLTRSIEHGGSVPPKANMVAFSQYPRRGMSVMGYSVRTVRYRYTEWQRRPHGRRSSRTRSRIVYAVELYDHWTDPGETVNVVDEPRYASPRRWLEILLIGGWRSALFGNETSRESDLESAWSRRRRRRLRLVTLPRQSRRSRRPTPH